MTSGTHPPPLPCAKRDYPRKGNLKNQASPAPLRRYASVKVFEILRTCTYGIGFCATCTTPKIQDPAPGIEFGASLNGCGGGGNDWCLRLYVLYVWQLLIFSHSTLCGLESMSTYPGRPNQIGGWGRKSFRVVPYVRACVRAVWLPSGNRSKLCRTDFPFSLLPRHAFLFSLWEHNEF